MTMDDEGNLGIGTTSPTDLLHVNGGASKPSTNTWTIVSDENLKTDISEFTDGLDVLRDINPIWFRYNGIGGLPTETLTPGVIAQEVLQVAPYMIDSAEIVIDTVTSETMPILTYNANALFYLLLNSVKELEQRTEELEELSGQVQSLSIANTELQNQYDDLSQIITACCASQSPSYRQASIPNVEPIKRQPSSLVVHPNPFLRETTVSYTITQAFSKAILLILDSSGKPVLQIPVLQKQGSVVITSEDLATGTYFCKLRVDGVNTEATRIVKIR